MLILKTLIIIAGLDNKLHIVAPIMIYFSIKIIYKMIRNSILAKKLIWHNILMLFLNKLKKYKITTFLIKFNLNKHNLVS